MSKVSHTVESLDEFTEALKLLAGRVAHLKKNMLAHRIEALKCNFEQRRVRGLSDLTTWLNEAETEVEILQLRAKKMAAK